MQYSQVEQSIQQTGVLKNMLAKLSSDDLASAGQLIGRSVEFDSSVSSYSAGGAAEWRWNFAAKPASLDAEVLDSSGAVIARPQVPLDASATFSWDGTTISGSRAPDGAYVLRLTATAADGSAMPGTLRSLGKVQEIVSREGELWAGLGAAALPLAKLVRVAA